jgi:cytoskeletal protein CcmA (bactofilin family)
MSFWNNKLQEATSPQSGADAPLAPTPTKPSNEERRTMAMLKRDDLTSAPASTGDLNALLGRGSEFEGKLTFEGTVRIDGKFNGTMIVHGEVVGNLKAKNAVELHQPARMKGNIETPSLMIEKGVAFEGQCKMDGVERGSGAKPAPSPAPVTAIKS